MSFNSLAIINKIKRRKSSEITNTGERVEFGPHATFVWDFSFTTHWATIEGIESHSYRKHPELLACSGKTGPGNQEGGMSGNKSGSHN